MGVLLVLLLGSGIAKAQTEYGFSICEVAVNSENVDKLDEIEGVTVGAGGHISYSPETNTLSIKNVSMQPKELWRRCLYVYSAYKNLPFTLHLEGKNQFNSIVKRAFRTDCNTRIEGSGELFIRANDDSGIFVDDGATLAIEDCSLKIVSETDGEARAGIDGRWNTQAKLVIKNASIYAKASGKEDGPYPYVIGGFESITLEGSVITQPSNAEIGSYTFYSGGTSYTKQFVMSDGKPATEVWIERTNDLYNFSICGVAVTKRNVNKLNEIEGVTVGAGGHISYSPETNTLSIKDVSMQAEEGERCLYVYSAYKNLPFTLHLEGKNQFNSIVKRAFRTDCNTRIEGSGELFIRANDDSGIFVDDGATLAIEDCSLKIVSETDGEARAGIDGRWNTQAKLVIKNASIYAKASGKEDGPYPYVIGGFESITLEGSVITQPSNAEIGSYTFYWDGASHTKQFVMSDGKPATEVRIEKVIPYEFSICGVGVNSGNVDKLDKIKGVTVGAGGHITYSPETNTLSIKDVSMQDEVGRRCLYVYSAYNNLPFTLHLEGKNQFNSTDAIAFWPKCDTRIDGSGKLSIRTKGTGIFVANDATLAIEDCTLDIVSDTDGNGRSGIDGDWGTQSKLVIKNASIYAKATGSDYIAYPYAIGGFESIKLEGVTITQPQNAVVGNYSFQWDGTSYTKQFVMSGDKPTKEVKIMKTLAVEEVDVADLRVYPNPATHYVQVEGAKAGASIALYSLEGIRLLAAEANEAGAVELDLTTLPAGNYVVKAGGKHLKLSVKH